MVNIPEHVNCLPRSGIRELMGLALCMEDAVHLEIGEPHFPTPSFVLDRLEPFYRLGEIKYTPTVGIPSLREKIAYTLDKEKGWKVDPSRIMILPGSLFGTVVVFQALLSGGDEVLIPEPGFTNHLHQVELSGATPLRYHLLSENSFLPDFTRIEETLTSSTKIILVNSPSNPLGVVFPEETMKNFARLAEKHNLVVISDEAYEKYVYEGKHNEMFRYVPPERLVSIFSFSKTYALTGWRVGYMVVPEELSCHLMKVEEYLIACTAHISQKAAEIALDMPDGDLSAMVECYKGNRDIACRLLEEAGFTFFPPQGGYYVWIDIREFGMPSLEFCKTLLKESCVALAPGDAFGESGEGFARISICRRREEIEEGIHRLVEFRKEFLG